MLVKHLPEQIKNLALTRQKEQNYEKDEIMSLYEAFDWDNTPEGFTFWESINCGIYVPFNEAYSTNYECEDWLTGEWENDEEMLMQEYESLTNSDLYVNMCDYWEETL
jgi:hypothetical protein